MKHRTNPKMALYELYSPLTKKIIDMKVLHMIHPDSHKTPAHRIKQNIQVCSFRIVNNCQTNVNQLVIF